MYLLIYFVPPSDAELTKKALFDIGLGKIGNYIHCCNQTEVTGQFQSTAACHPSIGEQNKLTQVQELRIEMLSADNLIKEAITVLKKVHPYEEVAYQIIKLEQFD